MFLKIIHCLGWEIKIIGLRHVIPKKMQYIKGYHCLTHPHQVYIEMFPSMELLGQ